MIVIIIVVLVYAGVEMPYIKEFQEVILKGIDQLSTFIDLSNLAKTAQNAFNDVRKLLKI